MRSTLGSRSKAWGVLAVALAMVSACGKSADTELFTNGGDGVATDGGTDASITTGGAMGDGSSTSSETGSSNNGSIDATTNESGSDAGVGDSVTAEAADDESDDRRR